jgi:hypothetical protein
LFWTKFRNADDQRTNNERGNDHQHDHLVDDARYYFLVVGHDLALTQDVGARQGLLQLCGESFGRRPGRRGHK